MKRLATTLFTFLFLAAAGLPAAQAQDSNSCFLVAGRTNDAPTAEDSPDRLTFIDKTTGEETDVATVSRFDVPRTGIEAIALFPEPGGALYAADGPRLGTIDTETGFFENLPELAIGSGDGTTGQVPFDDVKGLAFDVSNGDDPVLYGAQRQTTSGEGNPDVLLQINEETGAVVENAFADFDGDGTGDDYVEIEPVTGDNGALLFAIDDIAVDPLTGQLYGIANNGSGLADQNVLVTIDKETGETERVSDPSLLGVGDVEGFTVDAEGQLYASTGNMSRDALGDVDPAAINSFYSIADTGQQTKIAGPLLYEDYAAVACFNVTEEVADATPPQCGPIQVETNDEGRLTAVEQVVTDAESGIAEVEFTTLENLNGLLNNQAGFDEGDAQPFNPVETESVTIRGERISLEAGGAILTLVTNGEGLTAQCDPVVETLSSERPASFGLGQNYPNPFRGATTIGFEVAERAHVSLSVHDVLGRKVATLVDEEKAPGTYRVRWDASESEGLASGVYFYRVQMGSFAEGRRMVLVK